MDHQHWDGVIEPREDKDDQFAVLLASARASAGDHWLESGPELYWAGLRGVKVDPTCAGLADAADCGSPSLLGPPPRTVEVSKRLDADA